MQFKKRVLCSNISLILSASLFTLQSMQQANGQTGVFNCRPDEAAAGWICETTEPETQDTIAGDNSRYTGNVDDLFPDSPDASGNRTPGAPVNGTAPLSRSANDLDWVSPRATFSRGKSAGAG